MARKSKMQLPSSQTAWQAFSRRHPGCSLLAHDPLYALTEPLIDAIKRVVPDFFTGDHELFERDLAQTARFGFFLHQPIGSKSNYHEDEKRHQDASRKIDLMMTEELRRTGANPKQISAYFTGGAELREQMMARKDAYAGWLLMNPQYRDEVDHLRKKWEKAVVAIARFPRLPMTWMLDPTDAVELPPEFRDECNRFFLRWGLETLITWDWPVPMEADLNIGLRQDFKVFASGGMVLFIPWYLMRGEKLDMREIVQRSRLGSAPHHLLGWVNKRGGRKGDDLGDIRYGTIRWLYRYYELVLVRRYADACKRNQQRLDVAFANVLRREEDTVKKLRLELRKSLRQAYP